MTLSYLFTSTMQVIVFFVRLGAEAFQRKLLFIKLGWMDLKEKALDWDFLVTCFNYNPPENQI